MMEKEGHMCIIVFVSMAGKELNMGTWGDYFIRLVNKLVSALYLSSISNLGQVLHMIAVKLGTEVRPLISCQQVYFGVLGSKHAPRTGVMIIQIPGALA